jgi:hypothetical protein
MPIHVCRVLFPFVAFATLACHSARFPDGQPRPGSGIDVRDGAFVLTGAALSDGRGSVLGVLEGKVPNLKIRRNGGSCPEVNIRQQIAFQGAIKPHVYVDGTLSADTCILESLRSHDVESVEVYPQGFTRRPGYATHAHGLILVFMRGVG